MEHHPFRFLDLPGEIRNRIYQNILCSFEPTPPSESLRKGLIQIQSGRIQELVSGICPATHSIETAILCTSKQVHREAYDVMAKTNQFMHVKTIDISMSQLLIGSQIPIVTLDRAHAEQFQGYVMKIDMSAVPGGWVDTNENYDSDVDMDDFDSDVHAPPAGSGPKFSFMILRRDWAAFCRMLSEADIYVDGFSTNVKISLILDPWPESLSEYKAPITDLFGTKTQEALLKPFRTQLRGFEHVELAGTISQQLAEEVIGDVKQSRWTDPEQILSDLREAKDQGTQYYDDGKVTEASEKWTTAVSDVRRMRSSTSWDALMEQGGDPFVRDVAELQFKLLLYSAQNSLRVMNASPHNRRTIMTVGDVVSTNLQEAIDLPQEFEEDAHHFTYMPEAALMAKLYYAQAQCWRLMGEDETLDDALQRIEMAVELANGDQEIEEERRKCIAWAERVNQELANDPYYQEWMAEMLAETA